MDGDSWELIAQAVSEPEGWELLSPSAGFYARPPTRGARLGPGDQAGVLIQLGRIYRLLLPRQVAGLVDTPPPQRKHLPVGYKQPLLRLRAGAAAPGAAAAPAASAAAAAKMLLRAPQAGRFYRRPAPGALDFAAAGEEVQEGRTVGLLEVMKTFNPIKYAAAGELPPRAVIARFLVEDGAEVEEGQPLVEFR